MFEGETANCAWLKAAKALLNSSASDQVSRLGDTKEILHASISITNPRDRWVFSRTPSISPAFSIVEVFWILSGRNDAAYLNHWNPRLTKYQGDTVTYPGAYGHRLRYHFGVDQIERAYKTLSKNPESRQVVLQLWDPREDLPDTDGNPKSADIPCNVCSMPKVRDGKLVWLQVMRSNDIYRGLPYNIVQFTMLQEILAGWLGLEPGAYHHISDSLHVYDSDLKYFDLEEDGVSHDNIESLALPKSVSVPAINQLSDIFERLAYGSITKMEFVAIGVNDYIPDSYKNLLWIAMADSARRRKWFEEMELVVGRCKNEALLQLWDNWMRRFDTNNRGQPPIT